MKYNVELKMCFEFDIDAQDKDEATDKVKLLLNKAEKIMPCEAFASIYVTNQE